MDYRKYDERIDALLQSMTLDQKIGQLHQIRFSGDNFDEVLREVEAGRTGSLVLAISATAGNDLQSAKYADKMPLLQKAAMESTGIPLINGRDIIHGHRVVFPIPLAMAASFHPELIEKAYRTITEEASQDGIDWSFAPMLDISRDPRWGRCIEGAGEDPYLGARIGEAMIKGFQGKEGDESRIAACVKHYIGYGASEGGRDYSPTDISEISLRNYYLPAFRAAVDAGAATVMTSFNAIAGLPCTSSRYLLREVLKQEFGFDGFVVSDWGAVHHLQTRFGIAEDKKECAEKALNAGLDMDMVSGCFFQYVKELLSEGLITEEVLDDAVRRILRVKMAFGLFEDPYKPKKELDYEAHSEEAVRVAEECLVLLKNENGILPLKKDAKIAAVGPMVDLRRDHLGSWTLDFDLTYVKTIREAFLSEYPELAVSFADTGMLDVMPMLGKNKDVTVVFLGESAAVTGESNSLVDIELPKGQLALLKALKSKGQKVVAVLCFGRPIALEEMEPYCDAILYAWHGGSGAATAIVRTLMGDSVPSGSLPMTILKRTGQIPLYYNTYRSSSNSYYGLGNGKYNDADVRPMYPFGYGLSYTSFSYGEVKIENSPSYADICEGKRLVLSVEIENTGAYDAYETAQCYLYDSVAEIARPLRELCGFQKVFIKAGERATVRFSLGKEELGYYASDNRLRLDRGSFELYVGRGAYAKSKIGFILE